MRKPFRLSSRSAVGRRGTPPLEFTSSEEENARIAFGGFESPASSAARPALRLSALRRIGMTNGSEPARRDNTIFHDARF
jgi:hypothetical protein